MPWGVEVEPVTSADVERVVILRLGLEPYVLVDRHGGAPQEPAHARPRRGVPGPRRHGVDLVLVGPGVERGPRVPTSLGPGRVRVLEVRAHATTCGPLYVAAECSACRACGRGSACPLLEAMAQGAPPSRRRAAPRRRSPSDAAVLVDYPRRSDGLTQSSWPPCSTIRPSRRRRHASPRGHGLLSAPWARTAVDLEAAFAEVAGVVAGCDRDPPPGRRQPALARSRAWSGSEEYIGAGARVAGPAPAAPGGPHPVREPVRCSTTPIWWTAFPAWGRSVSPCRSLASSKGEQWRRRPRGSPDGPAPSTSILRVHHMGGTMPVRAGTPGLVTIRPAALRASRAWRRQAGVPAGDGADLRASRRHPVVVLTEWTKADVVGASSIDPIGSSSCRRHRPDDAGRWPSPRRSATGTASPTGRSSSTRRSPTPTRTTSAWCGRSPEYAAEDDRVELVLTGDRPAEEAVQSEIWRLGLADRVIRTGHILAATSTPCSPRPGP